MPIALKTKKVRFIKATIKQGKSQAILSRLIINRNPTKH